MTTDCLHEKLVSVSDTGCYCAECRTVFTIGDGLCRKCGRPRDDHIGARECGSKEAS